MDHRLKILLSFLYGILLGFLIIDLITCITSPERVHKAELFIMLIPFILVTIWYRRINKEDK